MGITLNGNVVEILDENNGIIDELKDRFMADGTPELASLMLKVKLMGVVLITAIAHFDDFITLLTDEERVFVYDALVSSGIIDRPGNRKVTE